jgi:GNAT superfamily N-acetyltransferase
VNQNYSIRPAVIADVPSIFALIQALAAYEQLEHQMIGTLAALTEHLFGDRPYVEAIVADVRGEAVGFALFFQNYSTFLTQPGIYLEDLFVLPKYRGLGMGKALLVNLAQIAIARNCGRLEWSVLDWNSLAIAFYEHMGATVLPDWRICRVTGAGLTEMAARNR